MNAKAEIAVSISISTTIDSLFSFVEQCDRLSANVKFGVDKIQEHDIDKILEFAQTLHKAINNSKDR